jgi:hypothetical protein
MRRPEVAQIVAQTNGAAAVWRVGFLCSALALESRSQATLRAKDGHRGAA